MPVLHFLGYGYSHSVLLRVRNVSDKGRKENKTHILCRITFFSENRAVYGIKSKNVVEPDMPQMTTRNMCFAQWITKDTDSHS